MNQQQQEQVDAKLAMKATPFIAPDYGAVIRVGANAVANEFAKMRKILPAHNMIDIVDVETQTVCLVVAKAVLDAVSLYGKQQMEAAAGAEAAAASMSSPKIGYVTSTTSSECACGSPVDTVEDDAVAGTTIIRYVCGAEVLAFDRGTAKEQLRTRRVCPVATSAVTVSTEVPV